jgi:hypothetical protein
MSKKVKKLKNRAIYSLLILTSTTTGFSGQMQRYLKGLEIWLNKWRLKITPHKCSFNIYRGNVPNLNKLPNRSLTIFSEKIPVDKNPKYLGVTIDLSLRLKPPPFLVIKLG